MLLLFMFTFGFSTCSHQNHVIVHEVVKLGMDNLSEEFPKAIEQNSLMYLAVSPSETLFRCLTQISFTLPSNLVM